MFRWGVVTAVAGLLVVLVTAISGAGGIAWSVGILLVVIGLALGLVGLARRGRFGLQIRTGRDTDPWEMTSDSERNLLAVFADASAVRRARAALLAADVPPDAIVTDDAVDATRSLEAEMRDELARPWLQESSFLARGAKGFVIVAVLASLAGLVIGLPFAAIDFGLTLTGRMILLGSVGLLFGATVGLIVGPALLEARPGEPLAAQRGVPVRVRRDSPELRQLLIGLHPLRVDELRADGTPIGTLAEEKVDHGTLRTLAANAQSDDYHDVGSQARD